MGSASGGPRDLIGRAIAGYMLERVLGVGATGAVFLARRVAQAGAADTVALVAPDEVAIKALVLPWQLDDDARSEFRARFLREAQTLQRLRHPHILPVLGVGEQDGLTYMVLPYLAGEARWRPGSPRSAARCRSTR